MSLIEKIKNNDRTFVYPSDLNDFVTNDYFKEVILKIENENQYEFIDEYTNTCGPKIDYSNPLNYLINIVDLYNFDTIYFEFLDDEMPIKSYTFPFKKIIIGNNIKKIPDCFQYDNKILREVILPNGLLSIGDEAFYGCRNLISINIPKTVESIGNNICGNCILLESIEVDSENKKYTSLSSNIIVDKDSMKVILGCKESKIPYGVKIIGYRSFYQQILLKTITIPDSIKEVEDEAFYGCMQLQKFEINEHVKIGKHSLPFLEDKNK